MFRLQNGLYLLSLIIGATASGQVILPPRLNCVDVNSNGDILLEWTVPTNNCGPFSAHYIYRSTSLNGPYALVASITNQAATSFIDPVGNGNTTVYYYYMESSYNCPGFTILQSDTLDNLQPIPPVLQYVSVVNGLAALHWLPSPSPEAYGYIIYKLQTGFNPYDTVYGAAINSYVDLNSDPSADTMSYTLATIDSCLNTSLFDVNAHRTILLKVKIDRCKQLVKAEWTPYKNWPNGVDRYEIYGTVNGSPWMLLATTPADSTVKQLSGWQDGQQICMKVIAFEKLSGFSSASNEVCFTFNVVQPANDFYVRNINVIGANRIAVDYSLDPLADLIEIRVERSVDSALFQTVSVLTPPADLSGIHTYIDSVGLHTDRNHYYYRFIARDSCGLRDTSTVGKTVLLTGYAFTDLSYVIRWTPSVITYATPLRYELFRDDGLGFLSVFVAPPDQNQFQQEPLTTPQPCFVIEAVDTIHLPTGINEIIRSRSNVLCLNQPSQIYMPNAFAPEGKNNKLLPILNVQGITSYRFMVFNRWGEVLFSTSDPTMGWDGKLKGSYVGQGIYAYWVDLVDGNGMRVEAKGTVMVLR